MQLFALETQEPPPPVPHLADPGVAWEATPACKVTGQDFEEPGFILGNLNPEGSGGAGVGKTFAGAFLP